MQKSIMQPVEFGDCLRHVLEKRRVSASELARLMEYKSRNTIFRILDGEGGHAARKAFYDKLIETDPLKLTLEERDKLTAALEVSRVGSRQYLDNMAIRSLLAGENQNEHVVTVLLPGKMAEKLTFDEVLRQYTQCQVLNIEISGCCRRPIFETIKRELIDKETGCELSIIHHLYTGAEEIAENLLAIQPLLFASCYKAYGIEPGKYSAERERIYRSNSIYIHVVQQDGSEFDEVLLLLDELQFICLARRAPGGFALAQALFDDPSLKNNPIKAEFSLENPSQELLEYTITCRRIEHNRAVYTVKLDMPISFIHPDLLVRAARDGFSELDFVPREELNNLIDKLYGIHLERFNNYFAKRRPTYTIFSRKAMEQFARTGKQTDHFFALRPFTIEERVGILKMIRDQASTSDTFSVFFFRDDIIPPNMEISLYEGIGVLLAKPFTDYNFAGDHAEAIIAQEDFCRLYKVYFCEDLLKRQVITKEETIRVFDELIETALNA
ncbi:MAG: hypothetical protein IJ381_07485 [Clostridia bacterium]|nr:hypothetical protein [Clostridia bacterium]